MNTRVGKGTCPVCGSGVRVMGSDEGTMYYESISQYTPDENAQLAAALKIVIGTHGAEVLPETVERMRALRTKCLSLAFMEVSRDA